MKAKIFLGDGGAYFLGSLISLIVIETSNLNQNISPFFLPVYYSTFFLRYFFLFLERFFLTKVHR